MYNQIWKGAWSLEEACIFNIVPGSNTCLIKVTLHIKIKIFLSKVCIYLNYLTFTGRG